MDRHEIKVDITGEVIECVKDKENNEYIIKLKIDEQEYNILSVNKPLIIGKTYNIKTVIKWNDIIKKYENIIEPTAIEIK